MDLKEEIKDDINVITSNIAKTLKGDVSGVDVHKTSSKSAALSLVLESIGVSLGIPLVGSMLGLAIGILM